MTAHGSGAGAAVVGVTMGAGVMTVVAGACAVVASGVLDTVESLDPQPVRTGPDVTAIASIAPSATLRTTPNRTCLRDVPPSRADATGIRHPGVCGTTGLRLCQAGWRAHSRLLVK